MNMVVVSQDATGPKYPRVHTKYTQFSFAKKIRSVKEEQRMERKCLVKRSFSLRISDFVSDAVTS